MAAREDTQFDTTRVDDEPDDLLEYEMELDMDDEEIYFDGLEPEETEEAEDAEDGNSNGANRYRSFTARRRIEIAREEKWLKSLMADFEDYDSIESLTGHEAERVSF